METTNLTQNSQSNKRTNIKSCIIESWKVFALNTKHYFKYLWFHFLIAGIGYALFTAEASWFSIEYIQPVNSYVASGYDASLAKALFSPSVTAYLTLALAFVAFVFANCIMYGAVFSQIRFYKATESLPVAGPFTFWREIKKDAAKTFVFDLIFIAITTVCLLVIGLIAKFTSWWVMLAAIPVFIYWLVIGISGRLQYIVENQPLKVAFRNAFATGHKKFGGYFIMLLLTSIPMLIITYAALLPSKVIQLSYSADMVSRLIGDPSGIPPYVIPLYMAVATVGYFIYGFAYSLQQWPLALFTSAICPSAKQKAVETDAAVTVAKEA